MYFGDFRIWIASYGYSAIFILLVLGIVGVPVPDETLLVAVGFLVLKGSLQPVAVFTCAFAGSVCGITISYMLGRLGGFTWFIGTALAFILRQTVSDAFMPGLAASASGRSSPVIICRASGI